ncbi:MAG: hypothetical protein COC15_01460 [Legionellales bacterium]|nr:MAG: hypothetical protein COC15_01460 [Legionellales bacterium]
MNLLELTIAMGLSATIVAGCTSLYVGVARLYIVQHERITRLTDACLVCQAIDNDINNRLDREQYYPRYVVCKGTSLCIKPSYAGHKQEILHNVVNFQIIKTNNKQRPYKILLAVQINGKISNI